MSEPVSLILTVLNEGDSIAPLLHSIAAQTRPPDDIVIVDGGSTDETVRIIDRLSNALGLPVRLFVEPGANISRGRNRAIAEAAHDLIAATDAGVRLDPEWLARLTRHFEPPESADFVSGFFLPDPRTTFEYALAAATLPAREEMGRGRFMPSSRSVAFRRYVWEAVGGYPEWADYSEDVLFDLAVMARGFHIVYEPDAIVWFRPRPSLAAFARQYRNYAYGDGQGLLWPLRHLIRYGTYGILAPLLGGIGVKRNATLGFGGLALGATVMFYTPYKRLWRMRHELGWKRLAAAAALIPLIRLTGDAAKMYGYPIGLPEGWRNRETVRIYRRGEGILPPSDAMQPEPPKNPARFSQN